MQKNKILRRAVLTAGILLLAAAAVLFTADKLRVRASVGYRPDAAAFIEGILPGRTVGYKEERSDARMPSYSYKGTDYAAILVYARFGEKCPVMAVWSDDAASYGPCLYRGSAYDGSLVIGGKLGFLTGADVGDELTVTDLRGRVFTYRVTAVKHAKNTDDATLDDPTSDLTLFDKASRRILRCTLK